MRVSYLKRKATLFGCLSIASLMLVACNSSKDVDTPPVDDQPGELSTAQRATLPDDCLFALDAKEVAYCFSPQDRNLMAVPADGSTYWRYPLPSDNDGNHVESVVIAGDRLVLVADTGPTTGDSNYEISRLYPDGVVSAAGEQRDSSRGTSFGLTEKDVELTDFESTRPSGTFAIKDLSFHAESEYHSEPNQQVSLGGSLNLSSPATSHQSISIRIDPPLAISIGIPIR